MEGHVRVSTTADTIHPNVAAQPVMAFILWLIHVHGFTLEDFLNHYGSSIPIERCLDTLKHKGLLTTSQDSLSLTEEGEQVLNRVIPPATWLPGTVSTTPVDQIHGPSGTLDATLPIGATGTREAALPDSSLDQSAIASHQVFVHPLSPTPLSEHSRPLDLTLLPMDAHPFVGRVLDINWLVSRLTDTATPVCAIYGLAGSGKTTLAGLVVRRLLQLGFFTGGVAVVDASRGTPQTILQQTIAELDVLGRRPSSGDLQDLEWRLRERNRAAQILVVLDDVGPDLAVGKVLAPLQGAAVKTLLISQHEFSPRVVPAPARHWLEPLNYHDALFLFSAELRRHGAPPLQDDELQIVGELMNALDNHPLALKLIARYLADNRLQLWEFAEKLQHDPAYAFSISVHGSGGLHSVFEHGMLTLPDDAALLFAALGVFPTIEFSWAAACSVGDAVSTSDSSATLSLLLRRAVMRAETIQLPEPGDRNRLWLHVLVHGLARLKFESLPDDAQRAIKYALSTYYAGYVAQLASVGSAQSLEIAVQRDKGNILGMLEWVIEQGLDELTLGVCDVMRIFWYNRWHSKECARFLPEAIAAGNRLKVQAPGSRILLALANVQFTYAQTLRRQGKLDDAVKELRECLGLRRTIRDSKGEAATLAELSIIERIRGNLERTERYIHRSLRIRRREQDMQGEAYDLSQRARLRMWQGQVHEAEEWLQQSLALCQKVGDTRTHADNLMYLGQIARQRGRLSEAKRYLSEALEIVQETQDARGQAVIFYQLGQVSRIRGDLTSAQEYIAQSLSIRRQIGDRRGEGEALGNLARVAVAQGRHDEAERMLHQSLEIAREVHDLRGQGIVESWLGRISLERGKVDEAARFFEASKTILTQVRDRRGLGATIGHLGRVAMERNDLAHAEELLDQSLHIAIEVQDRQGEARVREALSILAARRGKLKEAENFLAKAVDIAKDIHATRDTVRYLLGMTHLYGEHKNEPHVAQRFLEEAKNEAKNLDGRDGIVFAEVEQLVLA